MKLGFVSAILPEQSFGEVMEIAAEIGYDTVEIMCWPRGKSERRYAGVTHIDVETLDEKAIAVIHENVARTGVSLSGLGYYPNPLTPDAADQAKFVGHLRKVIQAAKALGLNTVNTFIGRDQHKTIDANWPQFLAIWRPIVDWAEQFDVRIGIENCPMLFGDDEWPGGKNLAISPAVWSRMFSDIPSKHFGLNLDPSHLIWQFIDPVPAIYEFRDRLFHIHAKDARVDYDKLQQHGISNTKCHTPKLPGLGDVKWGRFFGALTDVGYNGPVCVEVEDRAFEGSLENRKRSLIQSYRYLRQFVS